MVDENDAIRILEAKFDTITDYLYSWKGLYATIAVEFQNKEIAEQMLEHKSQSVEKYCLRVIQHDWTYNQLLEKHNPSLALRTVTLPPSLTLRELYE